MSSFISIFVIMIFTSAAVFADDQKAELLSKIQSADLVAAESTMQVMANGKSLNAFERKYTLREVGTVWEKLYQRWPQLKQLESLVNQNEELTEAAFASLIEATHQQIGRILSSEYDHLALQAIYRGIYNLSIIKSKTKFHLEEPTKEPDPPQPQEKQESQPPWNQSADQYKPRNKQMNSQSGDDGNESNNQILVETNAPLLSPLMGSEIFDVITGDRWSKAAVGRRSPYRDSKDKYLYKVHTYGQNNISLPLPTAYRPISRSSDVQVVERSPGEYTLITHNSAPVVELELIRQEFNAGAFEPSSLLAKYLIPTGIDKNRWPLDLLDAIEIAKKQSSDPLKQARAVGSYIKNNFQYYSNKLGAEKLAQADALVAQSKSAGDPDPVAFAKAKTCQCDGAAWILSSVARDFLQIPVRVRAGRTAVQREKLLVIRKNDPAHAWVEIWVDGKGWVPVDATPPEAQENSQGPEKREQKSGDRSIPDENALETRPPQPASGPDPDPEKDKDKSAQDATEDTSSTATDSPLMDEITKSLEQGNSKSPDPQAYKFFKIYFAEHLQRVAEQVGAPKEKMAAIEKTLDEATLFAASSLRAEQFVGVLKKNLNQEAERLAEVRELDGLQLQNLIQEKISNNEIRDAYYLLKTILGDFEMLKKSRSLTPDEKAYEDKISSALERLKKVQHPDAAAFDIVDNFVRGLSGPISKRILQKKYGSGYTTLGDPANLKLADDIKKGALKSLLPLSRVSTFTHLLLKKSYRPEYETRYFGKTTNQKQPRTMIVPVQDLIDLPSALLPPRSFDDLMEDCIQGKLYRYGYRRPIKIGRPTAVGEEILTLVLVDESGSMMGGNAQLAQSMIAAFIDHARAESSKKIQHNVVVIPFDDRVYPAIPIVNENDAEKYINEVLAGKAVHGGETDIEAALIAAYTEIAKSFTARTQGHKRPLDLRKANIWLITDGESEISPQKLQSARRQIPADVDTKLNVVFIGGKNPNLESFLKGQGSDSAQLIQSIDNGTIRSLLNPTLNENEHNPEDAFAAAIKSIDLDGTLLSDLRAIKPQGIKLIGQRTTGPLTSGSIQAELFELKKQIDYSRDLNHPRNVELGIVLEHLSRNRELLQRDGSLSTLLLKILQQLASDHSISQLNAADYHGLMELF